MSPQPRRSAPIGGKTFAIREQDLLKVLSDLPLGELRFFDQIGSTNDYALAWATQGAPDLSLVFADEQTAGRGRMGRRWLTPPGTGLAFSLILHPQADESVYAALIAGLAALALVEALKRLGVSAEIKWPNDVLVDRKKVAGILVESVWLGERIESVVLGMGVNVLAGAVPPANELNFPATSLEHEGLHVDRLSLLHDSLAELITRRAHLGDPVFVQTWEAALAFRGEAVQVLRESEAPLEGTLAGLERDGSLRLELPRGQVRTVSFGEVHLRPL